MSVIYTDIDNIKKYRNIMIDIDSSLFSYIKAKIKVKRILKRLNSYDIFELCFAYIAYNTAKYEIYDEKFIPLVSNKIPIGFPVSLLTSRIRLIRSACSS